MTIGTDTEDLVIDSTGLFDFPLVVRGALFEIADVGFWNERAARWNIDVAEEILMHVSVVASRVLWWKSDIFVQIEGHRVREGYLARLIRSDPLAVESQGCSAGG